MITLRAVGDIGVPSDRVHTIFDGVAPTLRAADISFGQLELPISARGERVPQVRHVERSHPDSAAELARAGFDVISWASNHSLDLGTAAFQDTTAALAAAGIVPVGVGDDIASARRVRVVERDGVRVAVLAYCSILPAEYWATPRRPGVAPLRAIAHWEPIEPDQPGTAGRVHTFAHPDDLAAMIADIRAAREIADVVVVSQHWGVHFAPVVIADYQRAVAHAAIDAGADLILGHHAHILKGVEVYRGRAIFYSLGNFAIELPITPQHASGAHFRYLLSLHPGWEADFDSAYNFPPDSRMTMIVDVDLDRSGIHRVGFRPAWIDSRTATPGLLDPEDPRFERVHDYVRDISAAADLPVELHRTGDTVEIVAGTS